MKQSEKITKLEESVKKILKAIKELKTESTTELKVGEWYIKIDNCKLLGNYQGKNKGYGFDYRGNWWSSFWSFNDFLTDWRLATNKEVKEALIKEAKKRGFKEGVKIKTVMSNSLRTKGLNMLSLRYGSTGEKHWLTDGYGGEIYENGIWAEIVEDTVVIPTINGYEMEVINEYKVKFGCHEFGKDAIKKLYKAFKNYNVFEPKIKSFCIKDECIMIDELREIVEYLDKL